MKAGAEILAKKDDSIIEIKDQFLEFLSQQQLGEEQIVHTGKLLTHPKNRGTLLINPYNAHRNGSMIRRVGANLKELRGAVCIEMHPDPSVRKELKENKFWKRARDAVSYIFDIYIYKETCLC